VGWVLVFSTAFASTATAGEDQSAAAKFREQIEPILADHCYACHGSGIKKGSVTLDQFSTDESILSRKELWSSVLKNVRGGLMPPAGKPRLSDEEMKALETWVKRGAFALDPLDPDPGRVTIRRLNRVEYRNTIRDLMGIDFRADEEFPADDSGYGFDNIGDALSVSPLLLEKYMQAAETIVGMAVPTVSRVVKVQSINGSEFRGENDGGGGGGGGFGRGFGGGRGNPGATLSLYKAAKVAKTVTIDKAASYRLLIDVATRGEFNFDPGRGKVTFRLDGKELMAREFGWGDTKKITLEFPVDFEPGRHTLSFEVEPLTPAEKRQTNVDFRILGAKIEGPLDPASWVRPDNFDRFFDRDDPGTPEARQAYAKEILTRFASKAYRRPADPKIVDKLVKIAESYYSTPGKNFEQGIGQAMTAVLASPRFLFRIESAEASNSPKGYALVDEYSLASRLSYFLWSTMPDAELTTLAEKGELRKNLPAQVKRLLADSRSEELIRNFTGQWLQSRDFEHFPIQAKAILRRDALPQMADNEVDDLKRSMKRETEAYFAYVLHEDRPILELIDSDYAFLNQTLAKLYGVPGVEGREVHKVKLPEGSPRGGLLTQAGVLMITSNPGRTSAVKRGAFILENILGTPTPPPPPDIPALEDALRGIKDREPTMREVMEVHRAEALCAACHNRMDPLGLAFENYNALGMWRDQEKKQPIDASGKLINGRTFKDARELKKILLTENKLDVYRCLTEKLMTYALGRGPEYQDVETVDQIVNRLEQNDGRFSILLTGIIDSSPFQKRRNLPAIASKPLTEPGAKP
jgi:mono/diheme cytochrome c family protein